jgi:selenocysteine lyase/cysteine desulfurase
VASVEAFEDGTPNFLSIAAIPAGLALLREIGMDRLHEYVYGLMATLLNGMLELRHENGAPRLKLYGPHTMEGRGATVAFNVLDSDGEVVYHDHVVKLAGDSQISLRGGCFCNPGAAEAAFEFQADRTMQCLKTLPQGEFSPARLSHCMGDLPVGAVRASLGMASNASDVDRLLTFLNSDLGAGVPSNAEFTASGP